jgi:N-acetylmuramoyl-L-alanine amidase
LTNDLPLRSGSAGDAVRDIQRRLNSLGYDTGGDKPGAYGAGTERAVSGFQHDRGLRADGICGNHTWTSLVEAGYRLGDRLLYLAAPMLRGDDVGELQQDLGALGFDAGRVDAIFGPRTKDALERFQRNMAITVDGVCGPDVIAALRRVARGADAAPTVAVVREVEAMREAPHRLEGRRFCIGETGGLGALADAIGRALTSAGAVVAVLHHPDESIQAEEANAFGAEAFLGIAIREDPGCATYFYAAAAFESIGGRRLAELALEVVAAQPFMVEGTSAGMRMPILRETRMPAVLCEIGPPSVVVEHTGELARTLMLAFSRWVELPVER